MTDDQITAIAREYAEFTDMSPVDKKNISAICECFLKYTLRRYCLVEKSKIKETWKDITYLYLAHRHITYDGARYLFDEVLFPEIAKEVEEERAGRVPALDSPNSINPHHPNQSQT